MKSHAPLQSTPEPDAPAPDVASEADLSDPLQASQPLGNAAAAAALPGGSGAGGDPVLAAALAQLIEAQPEQGVGEAWSAVEGAGAAFERLDKDGLTRGIEQASDVLRPLDKLVGSALRAARAAMKRDDADPVTAEQVSTALLQQQLYLATIDSRLAGSRTALGIRYGGTVFAPAEWPLAQGLGGARVWLERRGGELEGWLDKAHLAREFAQTVDELPMGIGFLRPPHEGEVAGKALFLMAVEGAHGYDPDVEDRETAQWEQAAVDDGLWEGQVRAVTQQAEEIRRLLDENEGFDGNEERAAEIAERVAASDPRAAQYLVRNLRAHDFHEEGLVSDDDHSYLTELGEQIGHENLEPLERAATTAAFDRYDREIDEDPDLDDAQKQAAKARLAEQRADPGAGTPFGDSYEAHAYAGAGDYALLGAKLAPMAVANTAYGIATGIPVAGDFLDAYAGDTVNEYNNFYADTMGIDRRTMATSQGIATTAGSIASVGLGGGSSAALKWGYRGLAAAKGTYEATTGTSMKGRVRRDLLGKETRREEVELGGFSRVMAGVGVLGQGLGAVDDGLAVLSRTSQVARTGQKATRVANKVVDVGDRAANLTDVGVSAATGTDLDGRKVDGMGMFKKAAGLTTSVGAMFARPADAARAEPTEAPRTGTSAISPRPGPKPSADPAVIPSPDVLGPPATASVEDSPVAAWRDDSSAADLVGGLLDDSGLAASGASFDALPAGTAPASGADPRALTAIDGAPPSALQDPRTRQAFAAEATAAIASGSRRDTGRAGAAVQAAIGRALGDVPPPEVRFVDPAELKGAAGRFHADAWVILVPETVLGSADPTVLARAVETAAHEAHHAEQTWAIARRRLGESPDASPVDVLVGLDLRRERAEQLAGRLTPLDERDPSAPAAESWDRTMYTDEGRARRNGIKARRDSASAKVEAARAFIARWDELDADPQNKALLNHPDAQKERARVEGDLSTGTRALDQAHTAYETTLAHEADAYTIGDMTGPDALRAAVDTVRAELRSVDAQIASARARVDAGDGSAVTELLLLESRQAELVSGLATGEQALATADAPDLVTRLHAAWDAEFEDAFDILTGKSWTPTP